VPLAAAAKPPCTAALRRAKGTAASRRQAAGGFGGGRQLTAQRMFRTKVGHVEPVSIFRHVGMQIRSFDVAYRQVGVGEQRWILSPYFGFRQS